MVLSSAEHNNNRISKKHISLEFVYLWFYRNRRKAYWPAVNYLYRIDKLSRWLTTRLAIILAIRFFKKTRDYVLCFKKKLP